MRPRFAAILIALLAAVAAPAGAAAPATPEGVPVPRLDWHPCHDGFECASAPVPREYRRPHGAKVRLGLVRHRAVDPGRRIGTLFFNPGGPGAVAAEIVDRVAPSVYQALSRFDVVAFEQRGVGASEPAIDCDELPRPLSPMTPDSFDLPELLRRGHRLAQLCLNRDPAFLASLNTGNVARDLDLLRAAVGDERLSYLGVSYGGMIGETYASLFPGRARALVLDSPVDADAWLNRPLDAITEQDVSAEASLDRFFVACAADRATCRFGGDDPEQAYDELLARLDANPLPAGDGSTVDGHELVEVTVDSLRSKRFWRPLAAALSGLEAGDPSALLALRSEVIGPGDDLVLDVFESYTSVERRYPRRIQDYLDFAEHEFAVAPHFATSFLGAFEEARHAFWPVRARGAFYGPFRNPPSATPVLVLHTTHDPATPYAWGRRVVRRLGNARLLTLRGDGHGTVAQLDPCVLAAVVPYLENRTLPPQGATCEQDIPFADSADRARPTRRSQMRYRRIPTTVAVAAATSLFAAAPAPAHEREPDAEIFATNNTRVITDPADPALDDRLRRFAADVRRIIRAGGGDPGRSRLLDGVFFFSSDLGTTTFERSRGFDVERVGVRALHDIAVRIRVRFGQESVLTFDHLRANHPRVDAARLEVPGVTAGALREGLLADDQARQELFGGSVSQDRKLILVAELADLELARRFAASLGGDLPAADTDYGDSEFVG